jgi:hypothetical protein
LLDDIVCIGETQNKRYRRLCTLVDCFTSQADITSYKIVDFPSPNAPELLTKVLARA